MSGRLHLLHCTHMAQALMGFMYRVPRQYDPANKQDRRLLGAAKEDLQHCFRRAPSARREKCPSYIGKTHGYICFPTSKRCAGRTKICTYHISHFTTRCLQMNIPILPTTPDPFSPHHVMPLRPLRLLQFTQFSKPPPGRHPELVAERSKAKPSRAWWGSLSPAGFVCSPLEPKRLRPVPGVV